MQKPKKCCIWSFYQAPMFMFSDFTLMEMIKYNKIYLCHYSENVRWHFANFISTRASPVHKSQLLVSKPQHVDFILTWKHDVIPWHSP